MEKFEWFMTHLPNVHIEARKYLDEKCVGQPDYQRMIHE